jgi:haloalkane dehalogenase
VSTDSSRPSPSDTAAAPAPGVLRTPDACFAGLPGFEFAPHYADVTWPDAPPLRMHYLDEGPRDAPVALLLHGEPTWCFLYRHMIGPIVAAGFRAIAPDWVGFGRSDKLPDPDQYAYDSHVATLRQLVTRLDLRRITLVCQDWGGPIGLRVLSEMPHRFAAVLATNTLLPTGEPPPKGIAGWPGEIIENWAAYAHTITDLAVDDIVNGVCVTPLADDVRCGYRAPFPDASYKAGPIAFPRIIPIRDDIPGYEPNRRAWQVLERFDRPFLTAFSDQDPSTKPWERVFQQRVPGARGQPHTVIAGGGHFVQEEQGAALAAVLVALMKRLRP